MRTPIGSHKGKLRLLLVCAGALGLSSCADLAELSAFRSELVAQFKVPGVSVNLMNGRELTLSFVNAPQASLEESERSDFARELAEFVRDRYSGYSEISTVVVAFSSQSSVGPMSVTRSGATYRFSKAQLGEPAATEQPAA